MNLTIPPGANGENSGWLVSSLLRVTLEKEAKYANSYWDDIQMASRK